MSDRKDERQFRRFCSRGDAAALGEVFDRTAPELLRLAQHLMGRGGEAEDLVQSTFLTAIERAKDFECERRLMPWLVGILSRHAANARRKRRVNEPLEHALDEPAALAANDAAREVEGRELGSTLVRTVARLPAIYGVVLRPYLVEGKSASELARELGLSPGAVRVRLHRGLKLLRRALPAGFTAGTTLAAAPGRGLGAVRASVLASARTSPRTLSCASGTLAGANGGALSASALLGGILVTHRIAVSAALVIAVGLTLLWWPWDTSGVRAPVTADSFLASTEHERSAPAPVVPRALELAPSSEREALSVVAGVLFQGRVLDASTEAPIAGASVWTTPAGVLERVLRARSGEDGTFEFRAMAEEELSLAVEAEGYALATVPLTERWRESFWEESRREVLDGGARIAIRDVRLVPGVSFDGRVVRASDRSPVAGAELVLCLWSDYSLFSVFDRAMGYSLADGRMSFEGRLPAIPSSNAGHYVLFALHEDGIGWTRVARDDGRPELGGIEIAIESGTRVDVRVEGPGGLPHSGATVRCLPLHEPFSVSYPSVGSRPAAPALMAFLERTTDADGWARFGHLPSAAVQLEKNLACHYELSVELEGRTLYKKTYHADCAGENSIVVSVDPDARAWITGHVTDLAGRAIEGAVVRFQYLGREASTDSEGSYRIERLPQDPRDIELRASKAGLVEARLCLDFEAWGTRLEGNDFVLREPRSIAGRVVDELGNPVEGVRVWAYGENAQIAGRGPESISGTDGRFEVADASAGTWRLSPQLGEAFERYEQVREGVLAEAGDQDVLVILTPRRPHAGRLELELRDAESGAALDAVHAMLMPVSEGDAVWTQELHPGRVVFAGLPTGRYDAWIAIAGRANGHAVFEIGDVDSVVSEILHVGRLARIDGRVDFGRAERPERCMVQGNLAVGSQKYPGGIFTSGGAPYFQALIEADGSFASGDLMPGTWTLGLRGEGVRSAEVTLELASGEHGEASLAAEPACVIELVLERTPERGWIVLLTQSVNEGEEAWTKLRNCWSTEYGPLPPLTLTVEPGRMRWRVLFLEKPILTLSAAVALPQEGELVLAPGERRRIPLRVD